MTDAVGIIDVFLMPIPASLNKIKDPKAFGFGVFFNSKLIISTVRPLAFVPGK